jgi:hypothetical protein
VDLQEDLVYDLLGDLAGAEMDLGVGVEGLLVAEVEGLEVQGEVQRGVHGLGQAEAVVMGRGVLLGVIVVHARLPQTGDMGEDPLR